MVLTVLLDVQNSKNNLELLSLNSYIHLMLLKQENKMEKISPTST